MGHKISKEQIDPGVKDYIMSFVGDVADLETEVNTDIISAVNSLMVDRVDNVENMGKLANAIGEPVTANHSVDEVVEGLGEMLSTFKTNMMNSGVMVESSDKFKQLIDKIKGLTEGEGNKGIQYIEGTVVRDFTHAKSFNEINGYDSSAAAYLVLPKLNFKPTILIALSNHPSSDSYYYPVISLIVHDYNYNTLSAKTANFSDGGYEGPTYNFIADELVFLEDAIHLPVYNGNNTIFNWFAFGVGEEDTTLRDSLASILQEEGVSVTEEDDMASLINKVDEEFDRKNTNSVLNIISATELPATGKEGQICVVTDNPTSEINVTANVDDYASDGSIYVLLGTSSSLDASKGSLIELSNNNGLKLILYYNRIYQNNTRLASYYYSNNMWNELTKKYIPLFEDGSVSNTELNSKFIFSSVSIQTVNNENVIRYGDTNTGNYAYFYTESQINFSDFNTIEITTKVSPSGTYTGQLIYYGFTNNIDSLGALTIPGSQQYTASTTNYTTTKLNISSWSGIGHLTFQMNKKGYGVYTYIQSIRLY